MKGLSASRGLSARLPRSRWSLAVLHLAACLCFVSTTGKPQGQDSGISLQIQAQKQTVKPKVNSVSALGWK